MAEDKLAFWMAKAAFDPEHKPEFFRVLMQSTIFVVGGAEGFAPGAPITGGAQISIVSRKEPDGRSIVPFFSALDKLQNFITGEVNYLSFSARKLFEATRGASLVLNPGIGVGWALAPDVIENLMVYGTDTAPTRKQ